MNADRRIAVRVITDLLRASAGRGSMPRKQERAFEKVVERLIGMEERSLEKMRPHADKGRTADNILIAEKAQEMLSTALELMLEGQYEEAATVLDEVAGA